MEIYHFKILDLLPYCILVLLVFVFTLTKSRKNYNTKLCIAVVFIFSAIRYGVGYDYFEYQRLAARIAPEYLLDRLGVFSRAITWVSSKTHFQVFFCITSFLVYYPLYKGCVKLSLKPAISIAIYVLFPILFLSSLCIVRNAIAYSFVFWAFALLRNEERIKSVIVFVCAIMFHYSALCGIFIYIFYLVPMPKKFFIITLILSVVLPILVCRLLMSLKPNNLLIMKLQEYILQHDTSGRFMSYVVNMIGLCCIFFWDNFKRAYSTNIYFLNFICFGVCLWNIFLPISGTLSSRLSTYYIIFSIVLFAGVERIFRNRMKLYSKIIVIGLFFLLFCSSFWVNVRDNILHNSRISMLPYQTIFHYNDYKNYK